jgi:GMP synthase (glutamine-hydrolysing)
MRIHWFQHVPFEGLGSIAPWAERHGHAVTCTRFYRGEAPPRVGDIDWLIAMGGPMSANDEIAYPWLAAEKAFVVRAVAADKTVLGICLGAQMIARALGADVYPNTHREIGWFPVEKTASAAQSPVGNAIADRVVAFHWHGETFDLPPGAVHLAGSEACRHQAFSYADRVVGLQYHLETSRKSAEALVEHCADELVQGKYIQSENELLRDQSRFEGVNLEMERLLNRLQTIT